MHKLLKYAPYYLAAGVAVALWNAHRRDAQQPRFVGLGNNASEAATLAETVLLWPYAIYGVVSERNAGF